MRKLKPKLSTVRLPLMLALATSVAGLMVGCNDKEGVNNSSDADSKAETALAEDQSITINNTAEPESIDPHKVSAVP